MYLSSDQKKIDYLSFDKIELTLLKAKARIAQLVERNLAKVEVAGSNPVSRSMYFEFYRQEKFFIIK